MKDNSRLLQNIAMHHLYVLYHPRLLQTQTSSPYSKHSYYEK